MSSKQSHGFVENFDKNPKTPYLPISLFLSSRVLVPSLAANSVLFFPLAMDKLVGSNLRSPLESSPSLNGASSAPKRKWSNFIPLFVLLVVVAEITFLGQLDMSKNMTLVDSWADLFHRSPADDLLFDSSGSSSGGGDLSSEVENETCEQWLERKDRVLYSRDFEKDPILVSGEDKVSIDCCLNIVLIILMKHPFSNCYCVLKEWETCAVGCKFGHSGGRKPDAGFGTPQPAGTASVLRSMESSQYYMENNIAQARRWVSTT